MKWNKLGQIGRGGGAYTYNYAAEEDQFLNF